MHIVFVYTKAEMHILHIIQLILLFPFVCEAVGEVEWKRGPELPHLTLYFKRIFWLMFTVNWLMNPLPPPLPPPHIH